MVLSREEKAILIKFRDARITKDVLITFTEIVNNIIKKRKTNKKDKKTK